MNKKLHIIFAFLINLIFIYLMIYFGFEAFDFKINFFTVISISLVIIIYSLLPDIDHKNSTITWFFFAIGIMGLIIGLLDNFYDFKTINSTLVLIYSTLLLICTFAFPKYFGHRGLIHTIWVGLFAVIPLWFVFHSFVYCIIAYVSWYSHLMGDKLFFKIK